VFNSTVGVTGTEAKTEQLGNLLKFLEPAAFLGLKFPGSPFAEMMGQAKYYVPFETPKPIGEFPI